MCVACAVVVPVAHAAGGASIASAPVVTYGQQEFGNTTTDGGFAFIAGDGGSSWWNLPVVTGDRITIDLTGQTEGDGFTASAYAVGTNDYNFDQRRPFAASMQNNTFKFGFTAPGSGMMPLNVYTPDSVGPYSFTASVQHSVVLYLVSGGTSSRLHETHFSLSVRNPDGVTITSPALRMHVQLRSPRAGWRTVRSGNVKTTFSVRWTPRQRESQQEARVQVMGPDYVTATTRALRVDAR